MSYESSQFDADKLRKYARLVARDLGGQPPQTEWVERTVVTPVTTGWWIFKQTHERTEVVREQRTVPGSRWLLGVNNSSTKQRLGRRGDYGEEHYSVSYYLEHDGELTTELFESYDGVMDDRYFQGSQVQHLPRPMNDAEILSFDLAGFTGRHHAWLREKGMGLSARLTKLRKQKR